MNRRDLLKQVAIVTGSAVIGGELFLTGCKTESRSTPDFTPSDIVLLDEVGETIIPETTTPGAKAVQIGEFMKMMVTDCYTEAEQLAFMEGIGELDSACNSMHGKSFMQCNTNQRKDLLISLEEEARSTNKMRRVINKAADLLKGDEKRNPMESHGLPRHYYTMMKQLTLLGFFTSETGMTETLRHVPVPGKYDGDLPYIKGEKAWAE